MSTWHFRQHFMLGTYIIINSIDANYAVWDTKYTII